MTKDEILQKHEDKNEYHFHQVDREWIMEAMQEYADQQLAIQRVSQQREFLLSYHRFLQEYLSLDLNEIWVDEYLKDNNCC